ncbi:alpha/beta hydrolase [Chloroflexus sp.]|uniref:alpha/beta fold hydrolase n=1 Tax=Chloroflexus sp. TaxID=1904827 RepID=UPI002ACD7891|nr:alpha/beta hydrolase [Chloroflexus sp.]
MPTIKAGDLDIHYLDYGHGEPVIFVHGNWASSGWWLRVLERLPAGYRGLAPDLRGRGATQGPDNDYLMPSLAADLWNFADALGIDRCHLVGHSLGAAVVLQAALDRPDRVRTIAVLAPPWVDGMPDEVYQPDRQQLLKDNPDFFAQAIKAMAPTAPEDDLWRELVAIGHSQRLSAANGAINALRVWKPGDTLRTIGAPALVMGGELDPLVTTETVKRAAAALGVEPHIIAGVGHSANLEAPDRFVELLAAHWHTP